MTTSTVIITVAAEIWPLNDIKSIQNCFVIFPEKMWLSKNTNFPINNCEIQICSLGLSESQVSWK